MSSVKWTTKQAQDQEQDITNHMSWGIWLLTLMLANGSRGSHLLATILAIGTCIIDYIL